MTDIKCVIIDDEEMAIRVIETHLNQLGGIDIIGKFQSAREAFLAIQSHQLDVIFLDIEMPGISGLELIKTLNHKPNIIITTAYRDYAIDGFELDVTDYLLKPISFERLAKAVSKVMQLRVSTSNTPSTRIATSENKPSFIYVKADRENVRIEFDHIIYIESLKNHVRIHTIKGPIITLISISKMMENLPSDQFVRIHKTHIVAIKSISKFSQTNVTIGEKTLAIGRLYKANVMSKLDEFLI